MCVCVWSCVYVKRMGFSCCTIYHDLSNRCVWVIYMHQSWLLMYRYCLDILNVGLHIWTLLNSWVSYDLLIRERKTWECSEVMNKENSCVLFVGKMKLCVAACVFMALFVLIDVGSSSEWFFSYSIFTTVIRSALCGSHVCPSLAWYWHIKQIFKILLFRLSPNVKQSGFNHIDS